jgi:hypothetical protein
LSIEISPALRFPHGTEKFFADRGRPKCAARALSAVTNVLNTASSLLVTFGDPSSLHDSRYAYSSTRGAAISARMTSGTSWPASLCSRYPGLLLIIPLISAMTSPCVGLLSSSRSQETHTPSVGWTLIGVPARSG